jgi:hypothetical protein
MRPHPNRDGPYDQPEKTKAQPGSIPDNDRHLPIALWPRYWLDRHRRISSPSPAYRANQLPARHNHRRMDTLHLKRRDAPIVGQT